LITRILTCLASIALALSFVTSASAQNITVTDTLGRSVEVPENAERILLGFYFEDFFAIGGPSAYERVVGISREAWEGWRNLQWQAYVEAVPRIDELADVGEVDSGTFSLEAAIAIKPDVAIIAAWQYDAMGEMAGRIESAGIPLVVIDYNAQTVEKHVTSTIALGAILGENERAKELADLYAESVTDIEERVAAVTDRPKVYVELARKGADEIGNSYGNTMWGRLVETAGGENIAKDQIAKWGPLNPEYVLAQNPATVFLAGSGWVSRDEAVIMGPGVKTELTHDRMQAYTTRPGWSDMTAVKDGSVHSIYHGGARTLYDFAFLQYIAKTLHPEEFSDLDPQASLDEFFDKYMPISFDGTYMTQLP